MSPVRYLINRQKVESILAMTLRPYEIELLRLMDFSLIFSPDGEISLTYPQPVELSGSDLRKLDKLADKILKQVADSPELRRLFREWAVVEVLFNSSEDLKYIEITQNGLNKSTNAVLCFFDTLEEARNFAFEYAVSRKLILISYAKDSEGRK